MSQVRSSSRKVSHGAGFWIVAIAFLLVGPAGDKIFPLTTQIGLVLLWIAAVVTLYTGYDYFRAGLKHIVDE